MLARWLCFFLLLIVFPRTAYSDERALPLTPETLWDWTWITDPKISPDGSKTVWVKVNADRARDGYQSDLWQTDAGGNSKRLTADPAKDYAPRWSPDGSRLAFLSTRTGSAQIYVLDRDGGESRQITFLSEGVSSPEWSPDGRRLSFLSRALTEEQSRLRDAERDAERRQREEARLVEGVEIESTAPQELVFAGNKVRRLGFSGFYQADPNNVWVVDVDDPKSIRRWTQEANDAGSPQWITNDRLVYRAIRTEDPFQKIGADMGVGDSNLYSVALDGESGPERWTDRTGPDHQPTPSPDGRWIAFLGQDYPGAMPSYHMFRLYLMRVEEDGTPGEIRCLTEDLDRAVGLRIMGDAAAPIGGGSPIVWTPDSRSVLFTVTDRGTSDLYRVRLDSEGRTSAPEQITDLGGDLSQFAVAATDRGTEAVALLSRPDQPYDLYRFPVGGPQTSPTSGASEELRRQTDLNGDLLREIGIAPSREIIAEAADGFPLQGWLLDPPGVDPATPAPMVLYVHGGPHGLYGEFFFHEMQVLASAGYRVLLPNPRGSDSYGFEFGNAVQYDFPAASYDDLMRMVDAVVETGSVDPKRLGIAGGSAGGILTSWAITRTHRFAAAISMRATSDFTSHAGTSDLNVLYAHVWMGGWPWEIPERYQRLSPLLNSHRVETPLLLIQSTEDHRSPVLEAEQLYNYLKAQDKVVELVIFPEASHGLSRTGRPSQRAARLHQVLRWFDQYLSPTEAESTEKSASDPAQ